MNGHLRRCRCASGLHVQTEYAPVRFSRRLASDAFLNRLKSAIVVMGLGLGACATTGQLPGAGSPVPTVGPSQTTALPGPTEGSLWPSDRTSLSLFQDTKASRVGDVVTVRIVENAQGSKNAKTASERTSSVEASTDAFLAIPASTANRLQADASYTGSFDGSGATSRSGALTADVTAVVTEVLPNGNLRIEGRREVVINAEKERILVSGVIRPEDIGPRNRIVSTVIADARIEYTGVGVVSDTQRPGWMLRILAWLWPF